MSLPTKLFGVIALGATLISPAAAAWPKRGLAANDDIPIWQFGGSWEGRPSQVNWQYSWYSNTNQKQSFSEFVPMLWGLDNDHTSRWWDDANYWLVNGGSGHLLAFNEPDHPEQASLTPQQAADGFRKYLTPFKDRAEIGSPAVTNGGYDWLKQFLNLCQDCGVEFIAVHWYNNWNQVDDLKNWINKVCALGGGRQVWLTEVRNDSLDTYSIYVARRNTDFYFSSKATEQSTNRARS